jgi:hypothetical protein
MIRKRRMVLAAPGPLLTPPPSSFPPKTPIRSHTAQIRFHNEEKNARRARGSRDQFGIPRLSPKAEARPIGRAVSKERLGDWDGQTDV